MSIQHHNGINSERLFKLQQHMKIHVLQAPYVSK